MFLGVDPHHERWNVNNLPSNPENKINKISIARKTLASASSNKILLRLQGDKRTRVRQPKFDPECGICYSKSSIF
ncbi:hypothetical protein OIU76_026521 [Salix suchowensis]|nr:hypothetical protein OIU76_026521 [Salix suchowensis]